MPEGLQQFRKGKDQRDEKKEIRRNAAQGKMDYDGFRHMEDVLLAEQYAKLPRWTRNLVVASAENS